MDAFLQGEYRRAITRERTAETYDSWRDEHLTQVAVAWILGCVFVRFLEDNALVDPPRLSGPGGRRSRALDEHNLYFRAHPTDTDREYLLHVFRTVAALPVAGQIFDERHNPLWPLGQDFRAPSGDAATRMLGLWQRIDPDTGALAHDFTDSVWDTRFLGDLYQDLSESARKRYALLQTPEFVEEFILDRTLDPAVEEFGFREVRLIDPACGSGHFLLGAFRRLDALWARHEPGTNPRERTSRVLEQVVGVDLNPFAAAVARFRLCIAALRASAVRRLADAPAFELHVAAGDSLLHGPRPGLAGARQDYLEPVAKDPLGHVYRTEDAETLRAILGRRYHVAVGNPPYITPKDKAHNQGYRERFGSCYRQYSLAVPFTERFFDLAHAPAPDAAGPAGFVGMITANSFMKREFGRKLIEEFMPRWDLVEEQSVPLLPVLRYKPSGLRKRAAWERTWDLQRREDAIDARIELSESDPEHLTPEAAAALKEKEIGAISVPPRYTSADFRKGTWWRLRGKLDVPKERFFSLPFCEREADPSLVIGWAGWNALEQSRAVAAYCMQMREQEGWTAERLTPLLTALLELLPWVRQYHNAPDPEFDTGMGDYFEGFIDEEMRALSLTRDAVRAWTPPAGPGRRGVRRRSSAPGA